MRGESINRLVIAKEVAEALPALSQTDAVNIVEGIVACFTEKFMEGEEVKISGFGKFTVCEKAQRKGRNPQTG